MRTWQIVSLACLANFCASPAAADNFEIVRGDAFRCVDRAVHYGESTQRCTAEAFVVNTTTSQWYWCSAMREVSFNNPNSNYDKIIGSCVEQKRPSSSAGPFSYSITQNSEAPPQQLHGVVVWIVEKAALKVTVCFHMSLSIGTQQRCEALPTASSGS